jgi:hypothetical protein
MVTGGSVSYGEPPRRRIPGWVWGLGVCACLPIVGIFVLGLVATPVFRRIRDAQREVGRTRVCLDNVRQTATAMQAYSQDYDERLPLTASWQEGIGAYVENAGAKQKTVLRCPTVQVANPQGYGYAFNSKLAGKPASKIASPTVAQIVYDSTSLQRDATDPVTSLPSPGRHRARGFRQRAGTLVNIMGYVDGHAAAVNDTGRRLTLPGLDTSAPQ